MSAILHVGGEQFLANLLAGFDSVPTTYQVGLGNWSPAVSDTYANVAGEPSGNGYSRHQLSSNSADLTVDAAPTDGYMVIFNCSFAASGADWSRVKRIHLGDGSTLILSIPITADMVDPAAGLDWDADLGLLIPAGCTFSPVAPLYMNNRNAVAGSAVAPKPEFDTAVDAANPITSGIVFCSWMLPDATGQECLTLTDVSGNELHGTLSGLDPVPPVVVTGAGSTAYNQTYDRVSTTQYNSADGLYKLLYFDMSMCWVLLPMGSDPMMDGYAYYNNDMTSPTAGTWAASTGIAPPPTVAAGTGAEGPWTAEGLQFNGSGHVDLGNSPLLCPQVPQAPVVVSGASGGSAVVNQEYTKSGSYYVSADTNYKIMLDPMMYPDAPWIICTSDYDPMAPQGTLYFTSSTVTAKPQDATWTGVTVAEGEDPWQEGDPTGMTIHVLLKVGTVVNAETLISRWYSGNAGQSSYGFYRVGALKPNFSVYDSAHAGHGVEDCIPPTAGQVMSLTAVWDGSHTALYRDGTRVTAWVACDSLGTSSTATMLGCIGGASPGWLSADEIRLVVVWQRGLTDGEVREMSTNPYGMALGG